MLAKKIMWHHTIHTVPIVSGKLSILIEGHVNVALPSPSPPTCSPASIQPNLHPNLFPFLPQATGATSIKAGGLEVEAGGLRVGSGGLTVESGGLVIDGGVRLRSGTLTIDSGHRRNDHDHSSTSSSSSSGATDDTSGFEVANGGIRTVSKDTSTPALTAVADANGYGGAVFSIAAPASIASSSFRLLQGTVAAVGGGNEGRGGNVGEPGGTGIRNTYSGDQEVFIVDGTGRVTAAGGVETGDGGDLVTGGGLVSKGKTVLARQRAVRDAGGVRGGDGSGGSDGGGDGSDYGGGYVTLNADLGTFFEVPDDGRLGSANVVRIQVCFRIFRLFPIFVVHVRLLAFVRKARFAERLGRARSIGRR